MALGGETAEGGVYALKSLSAAVDAYKKADVDVLITAPINKHNIQSDEFNFPGIQNIWQMSLMEMKH